MIANGLNQTIMREEKQRALERLLASQTLIRCDQLKKILSYLCGRALEGRPEEITEYLIGVEALGREADFSPTDDSSVRSRLHALRKKLQEYYLLEAPDEEVRIEFPKGSYVPQYLRIQAPAALPVADTPVEVVPPLRRWRTPSVWVAFLAGVVFSAALGYGFRQSLTVAVTRGAIPAIIREAWGPLLEGEEVLVVVATPAQLFLRDYGGMPRPKDPAWMPDIKETPDLLAFYGRRQPVSPRSRLLFHPNLSSPLWGDAAAAISAVATLATYRVGYRVLPERLVQPYLLRNRNVLLFGRPEYSAAARSLMENAPFVIEYEPALRSWVLRNRSPRAGEPAIFEPRGDGMGGELEVYGLLTVLPSETPTGARKRTVIFSGLTTAGAQAAEEFFSTPEVLKELQARFRQEGLKGWPQAWQLVLKTSVADATLPMSFSYQAHRVIQK